MTPSLLSLPDDAILKIFANFHEAQSVAISPNVRSERPFGRRSDATNLAATHPRFHRLHRLAVVTELKMTVPCVTDGGERIMENDVQLYLHRYPGTEKLRIGPPILRRFVPRPLGFFMSTQLRIVVLIDAYLIWGNIRALFRSCPDLSEMELSRCSMRSEWTDMGNSVETMLRLEMGTLGMFQVQKLNLRESPGFFQRLVTHYAFGSLQELNLSGCQDLRSSGFDACAAFSKLKKLVLRSTGFSSADATRIFPSLSSLQELDVSFCGAIDSTLWAALPVTVVVLRASMTRLFNNGYGYEVIEGCGGPGRNLRVLEAAFSELSTWSAMSSGFGALRDLRLEMSNRLGDERVEEALAAMPLLEDLHVFGCKRVGDRTAAAIARHRQLTNIAIYSTKIGDAGVEKLSQTFLPGWPIWVRRS